MLLEHTAKMAPAIEQLEGLEAAQGSAFERRAIEPPVHLGDLDAEPAHDRWSELVLERLCHALRRIHGDTGQARQAIGLV